MDIETAEAQAPMTAVGAVGQILEEKMELHGPLSFRVSLVQRRTQAHRSSLLLHNKLSNKDKGE